MMRRFAFCSPVNPAPSGISDYSEELLPFLGQYARVDLYVDDGLTPGNPALARHLVIRPISRLEAEHRRAPYDAIIYHMGNSPAHTGIFQALQRVPGVVVLHDYVLHHFMLGYAATTLRDLRAYHAWMQRYYGAAGTAVARVMMAGRLSDAAFDFPLCEPILAAARGLIVHSQFVAGQVQRLQPGLPHACVPMGVPLPEVRDPAAARRRLGLPPDALLLASFGHINPYKRVEPALRAFRTLLHDYPGARYLLVGSVSSAMNIDTLVARMGLRNHVVVTGHVPRAQFEDYVAAADICLNLRHPTAGETSASLLRLLGAGKPTLVSATGSFAELPAGTTAQVDPDASEQDLILAYCRLLAARPAVAAALGAAARQYVAEHHTLPQAAAGYTRFLARLYGWEPLTPQQPPLWDPAPPGPPPAPAPAASEAAPEATPASALVQHVAQAVAELGLSEQDSGLLQRLARELGELDPH